MANWKNIVGRWGSGDGEVDDIRIDASTNSLQTIDYAHHEIHSGSHYKAGFGSITQILDTDDTIELLFVTPDTTEYGHWTLTAQATAFAKIELFEDATATGGTAVTRWNRNRNSDNESSILAYHTPSVTVDGTKFSTKFIGGTGFKSDIGGETRGSSEIILKRNTKYLIRGTALADDMSIQIGGDWYEHEDKH